MKILIVGSGGREHAIAWKVAQSPLCSKLYTAPGNPGTAALGENVPLAADDVGGLARFARESQVDLVIVGPEASLAVGLSDALRQENILVFGPSRAAAQIESSKVFSKQFMQRHSIPTARFAVFSGFEEALAHVNAVDYPIVIKASGLAAGKGVLLPQSIEEAREALRSILVEKSFGAAGEQVVIEERLEGEEVSLLAFTDGVSVCVMPPAQDHKRLLEGDLGPNTGGMGAYAPAPVCPPGLIEHIQRTVLQPAVDGLRAEGLPFTGVLYAGMILTAAGPLVLEFNCRFGDPETQVILPLLESDLVEICAACAERRLGTVDITWRNEACATVVLASPGYPGKYRMSIPIQGLEKVTEGCQIFHAGTRMEDGQVITAGGRVLNVTGTGVTLREALAAAYRGVQEISFEGMHYRKDIAHRALPPTQAGAYAASGVDINAGNRAVDLMKTAVRSTYTPAVLAGIGAFGGLFDAGALKSMHNPVLVASTDGVGTKVRLAAAAGRYECIGQDIVNHCINDILVQGARPLFFLDYFATARLDPEVAAAIVSGIAAACREAGCVLLGGETAEMPGVYGPGEFDVAGTIVGVMERERILPRGDLQPGDLLVGLESSGPHTNGYSLIRQVFKDIPLDRVYPQLHGSLADALLAPHRSYLPILAPVLDLVHTPIKALAHLTGGGFIENIPRVLPEGLQAVVERERWTVPPLFGLIQQMGNIDPDEMYRVFNMGIGMVAVVGSKDLEVLMANLPVDARFIGYLQQGERKVILR